jgi:hypothetical protein
LPRPNVDSNPTGLFSVWSIIIYFNIFLCFYFF